MAGFLDTFKPVNVAAEKNELGQTEDIVGDAAEEVTTTTPPADSGTSALDAFTSVETPTEVEEPALTAVEEIETVAPTLDSFEAMEDVATSDDTGWGIPLTAASKAKLKRQQEQADARLADMQGRQQRASDDQATRFRLLAEFRGQTEAVDPEVEIDRQRFVKAMLPEGVKPFSYSEDDISESEDLYPVALEYMTLRFGLQAIEGETKKDIVTKFINSRRGNYLGNSWDVLAEFDFLYSAKDDPDQMEVVGRAYTMYENMAGITSDEVSKGEAWGAILDTTRLLLLDPVNAISFGLGKFMGGIAVKNTVTTLEKFVMAEVKKKLLSGMTPKAIKAASAKIFKDATLASQKAGTAEVANFAANMSKSKGLTRIFEKAGLAEVGTTVLVDSVTGSGFEFLYQDSMVDAGVQEEVNKWSVGLAAVMSLGVGAVSVARVARRGKSETALPSVDVKKSDPKVVAAELQKSLKAYFKALGKDMDDGTSWASKVGSGKELHVKDTDFFADLLLGVNDKDGNVLLKGLAQTMQEGGFYFAKRNEDDKLSNWVSDFILEMDPKDLKGIISTFEESAGIKLKGLGKDITPKSFSDAFAKKMNDQARGLNSMSQVAKRLNVDVADMDVDMFLTEALGMNVIGQTTRGDKIAGSMSNRFTQAITAGQNRFIRSLVAHSSTSYLNVMGWSVSSALGSTNDITRGLFHLGKGQILGLAGMHAEGKSAKHIGNALIQSNINRVKLLLDPDMTAAAYKSALQNNAGAMQQLSKVQAGGIDVTKTMDQILNTTKVGNAAETYVNAAQLAGFVNTQDILTKSQEYVFQMDKNLRLTFGKSWNEFYNSPDAAKMMATKEFKELELTAVTSTLEHTFSQSYKGRTAVGELAGFVEDARNIPGLGLMVPFGKFFNNTVDFTIRNTPVLNQVIKYTGNKYPNKTHGELFTQGIVAGGIVYSMASSQQEKRSQGLGMYDSINPLTGQVVSKQYDYPVSLFMAAGRLASYLMNGETPPPELIERMSKDFGGNGLTRNLTKTGSLVVDTATAMFIGDLAASGDLGLELAEDLAAQISGGLTRPLEAVDMIVGIVAGTEMRPQNVKDGNRFVGKALTYIDNTAQMFMGKPFNDVSVSGTEGEMKVQTTKVAGTRAVQLTDARRLMNMLSYDSWDENASYKASRAAPGAANEYNRKFYQQIDAVATELMGNKLFRAMTLEEQRGEWENIVGGLRDGARSSLAYDYTGAQSTFGAQISITSKYSLQAIDSASRELGINNDLGGMSEAEIEILQSHLDSQKAIDNYNRPSY